MIINAQRGFMVGAYTYRIMRQIHDDMRHPFPWGKQIPRDVGSFSGLHDYCDANEYLIDAVPKNKMLDDEWVKLLNDVSDAVDRKLASEAIALDTGERCECGRLVRFNSGHVVHIDNRSHACKPCGFCSTFEEQSGC